MTAAFSVSGLCKRYHAFALQDITLELPAGCIMGLVGVNGAGKTTLLRILTGLAAADTGSVEVHGLRLPEQQVEAKRGIGFASEDMRLYRKMSLDWHMKLIAQIYPSWDADYAAALLRRFELRSSQAVGEYSHGQRVKALLLLSLARRPRLLLLDEPTTGLDPVARAEVLEALAEVLRDERRSVLFSSHNTHDVEQLADSIAFLHGGRLVAHADKERFFDQWRRLLGLSRVGLKLEGFPEIASVRAAGSQVEIKVRSWHDDLPARLSKEGIEVQRIDPMTLEDIFVTSVRAGGQL